MKIGIDFDEVLVDTITKFIEFYNFKYGKSLEFKNWHSYNFWEIIGGTKEESIELFDDFYFTKFFDEVRFLDGALESTKKLIEKHELVIVTSRPQKLRERTEKFLTENFGGMKIIYSGDFHPKNGKTKAEICKENEVDIFIEDNLKYAEECAKNGVKVFLMDKPWNQGELTENIFRVKNWEEILAKINLESPETIAFCDSAKFKEQFLEIQRRADFGDKAVFGKFAEFYPKEIEDGA